MWFWYLRGGLCKARALFSTVGAAAAGDRIDTDVVPKVRAYMADVVQRSTGPEHVL